MTRTGFEPGYFASEYNSSNLTPGMQVCGFVRSVEDHGYIVDVGKENVNAFIPAANPGNATIIIVS